MSETLQSNLQDWTDTDGAIHDLARVLGIIPIDSVFATQFKWIGNCNNPIGNTLFDFLCELQKMGAVEADDEWRFRWNPTFEVK